MAPKPELVPDHLAEDLAAVIAPGEEAEVAAVIAAATELDDAALAAFLRGLGRLIERGSEPLRGEQVRELMPASFSRSDDGT